jgi:phosphoribosylpyrophosphate synthetase
MALANAQVALAEGRFSAGLEWLRILPEKTRAKSLEGILHYAMAKEMAFAGNWPSCVDHLADAARLIPEHLYQKRLALARRREPGMSAAQWATISSAVDPAVRLASDALDPLLEGVWACGAYHSRGRGRALPWSRFLPLAKSPPVDDEETRRAVLALATGFFCKYLATYTPLMAQVDAVVSIPANPIRYGLRMMSLPDELAHRVERHLAIPFIFGGLVSQAPDLELRGLNWYERRVAIRNAMRAGDIGPARGRTVLVVDDILTSGATLGEAARILREAGVAHVYGMVLSHTEG